MNWKLFLFVGKEDDILKSRCNVFWADCLELYCPISEPPATCSSVSFNENYLKLRTQFLSPTSYIPSAEHLHMVMNSTHTETTSITAKFCQWLLFFRRIAAFFSRIKFLLNIVHYKDIHCPSRLCKKGRSRDSLDGRVCGEKGAKLLRMRED